MESAQEDESEFEEILKRNAKLLFGPKVIYIDLNNKVESKEPGGTTCRLANGFARNLGSWNILASLLLVDSLE